MKTTQSMELTQRDKQLVMFLPAILAVIVYFWVFTQKPNARLKALVQQVDKATKAAPPRRDIENEMIRGANLQKESEQIQKTLQEVQQQLTGMVSAWSNASVNVATSDDLAALWRRHELVPLSSVQIPETEAAMAPGMARVAQHLRPLLGTLAPRTWEVKLQGGYPQMLEALRELSQSRFMVLPLSLSMTNSIETGLQDWTLKLWM